eukprot:CAMPEP_0174817904 /NCGR_PEP_ID=MMETSP1107-20130205/459_1 /TAXON_ID=36770 /ORGANISM="Paraphysomonas vestita, Strain GFlagA" /LENGTH=339 /DNA_ID=CAMNT_0016029029 /DNA_START=282 /DNA_END=1301 /DNA_ORIENTATION=-
MKELDLNYQIMIEDVQEAINYEAQFKSKEDTSYFESYHTWEEVQKYIEDLAAEFPSHASVSTIGNTYQGRPIKIIKIQKDPSKPKKTIWIDGGLHAREWIAVPTVSYIADTVLRTYGTAAGTNSSTFLLDNFDLYVAPILNVDGYEYTWNGDRMWRKTRSPNAKSPCVGTDPNRNWNFHWGEAGSSTQACSDSYQGPSPASEVEVQTIQSYLCGLKDTLVGYINFHAYSQLWMSPWGYTDALPADYADQNGLSAAAVAALKSVHGTVYDYGTISNTIYPASGSSADYTYGVCGVKYSYGVELRDTGKYGFLLPPNQIIPSGEETYAAIIAMAKYIDEHP